MDSISIIAPAYNEQDNLRVFIESCASIRDLEPRVIEVIIINDASTDGSAKLLEQMCYEFSFLKILTNSKNIGCHPSVIRGFQHSIGQWLLFLPTDNQILPNILVDIIPHLEDNDLIGTRRSNRSDPLARIFLSTIYNYILRLITGISFHDFDSSIFIRRNVFDTISSHLSTTNVAFAAEIALLCHSYGYRSQEFDIPHYPRKKGVAKGINSRDIISLPYNLLLLARKRVHLRRMA